jgi:hypothetical protein
MSAMKGRIPLVISGDMHAIAIGRMLRSGTLDLTANPVNAVLSGPIGTRPAGWPSERRGTGALPPLHLDLEEQVKPIEQHGFTIVDFTPDKIVLRFFKWDLKTQAVRGDRYRLSRSTPPDWCGRSDQERPGTGYESSFHRYRPPPTQNGPSISHAEPRCFAAQ